MTQQTKNNISLKDKILSNFESNQLKNQILVPAIKSKNKKQL